MLKTEFKRGDASDLSYLSSVYFGFHLAGGHVGLPILVLLFLLSKRVQRPATVINFCVIWIIYAVSYSLMFYGGYHATSNPPFKLCLVQASMIHGAPPMAAVAGLEVVFQAWTIFMLPWQRFAPSFITRLPKQVLIMLLKDAQIITPPYLVFLIFALVAAYIGFRHPEDILSQTTLHCTIVSDRIPFQRFAVPVFCAVLMTAIIVMEVVMIYQYCRGWRVVRQICPLATHARKPSLSPWFRVTIFTAYSIAALGTCLSYLSTYVGPLPYMLQATMPLVATLVFGSQSDILNFCLCTLHKLRRGKQADCQEIEYTPNGGWSVSTNTDMSPHLTGHLSIVSTEAQRSPPISQVLGEV